MARLEAVPFQHKDKAGTFLRTTSVAQLAPQNRWRFIR